MPYDFSDIYSNVGKSFAFLWILAICSSLWILPTRTLLLLVCAHLVVRYAGYAPLSVRLVELSVSPVILEHDEYLFLRKRVGKSLALIWRYYLARISSAALVPRMHFRPSFKFQYTMRSIFQLGLLQLLSLLQKKTRRCLALVSIIFHLTFCLNFICYLVDGKERKASFACAIYGRFILLIH